MHVYFTAFHGKSVTAAGYVLVTNPERGESLLEAAGGFLHSGGSAAEPVARFAHSRTSALVVFASFEKGKITHIAKGRKGASAGTGLVRLNMAEFYPLAKPIAARVLTSRVPSKVRKPVQDRLADGGLLPPKSFQALVEVLSGLDAGASVVLDRYSQARADVLRTLTSSERSNLAAQKETLTTALKIAGIDAREVLEWTPSAQPKSFLDGLPEAIVREDVMLVADFDRLPGFHGFSEAKHIASKTFVSREDADLRVTVVMANRLQLERQTGSDLIYYNETFRSFVMVQYKAMEAGNTGPEFRWAAGDQFSEEIGRMNSVLVQLSKISEDEDPDGFRLATNPFFLKFCSRVVFDPDSVGLFPGMYFHLDHWKRLADSGRLTGSKGGQVLTYENVGRRMSNNEFVSLVAGAWIGTTIPQSVELARFIREVISTGKNLTFAVEHKRPPRAVSGGVTPPESDHGLDALFDDVEELEADELPKLLE